MSFGQAISTCLSKYATFTGRATRSEFWYFYLFYTILYFPVYIVSLILAAASGNVMYSYLTYVVIIPLFLPSLAAAVRRLHDTNRSGWFYLVPVYNVVLLCTSSDPGPNRYGPPAN